MIDLKTVVDVLRDMSLLIKSQSKNSLEFVIFLKEKYNLIKFEYNTQLKWCDTVAMGNLLESDLVEIAYGLNTTPQLLSSW